MSDTTKKKVNLELVGLNGNAFALIGAFRRQARNEGWTKQEIVDVTTRAMAGNYDHLLTVLMDVCENREDEE